MEQPEVLNELGKIGAARRGQLSEQWYETKRKNGETHKTGPYYVLARCVGGKKSSTRVSRDTVVKVREELERGKTAAALIEKFWENAESLATQKKTTGHQSNRP